MKQVIFTFLIISCSTSLFSQTQSRSEVISDLTRLIKAWKLIFTEEGQYSRQASIDPTVSGVDYSYSGDRPGGGYFNYSGTINWRDICAAERTWRPGTPETTYFLSIKIKSPVKVPITYPDQDDSFFYLDHLIFQTANNESSERVYRSIMTRFNQLGRMNGCE